MLLRPVAMYTNILGPPAAPGAWQSLHGSPRDCTRETEWRDGGVQICEEGYCREVACQSWGLGWARLKSAEQAPRSTGWTSQASWGYCLRAEFLQLMDSGPLGSSRIIFRKIMCMIIDLNCSCRILWDLSSTDLPGVCPMSCHSLPWRGPPKAATFLPTA